MIRLRYSETESMPLAIKRTTVFSHLILSSRLDLKALPSALDTLFIMPTLAQLSTAFNLLASKHKISYWGLPIFTIFNRCILDESLAKKHTTATSPTRARTASPHFYTTIPYKADVFLPLCEDLKARLVWIYSELGILNEEHMEQFYFQQPHE